jgi:hypothetical protein
LTYDPHLNMVRPANRHARLHAHAVGHPIVQSLQPGDDWRWCYVEEALV